MDRCDLTILGDRQSGKTYVMTSMAVDAAANGENVAYHAATAQMAHDALLKCVHRAKWLYADKIEKVFYSNGRQRIKFIGGGQIKFNPTGVTDHFRKCDLEILDETLVERSASAKRSVRTVLR